MALPTYLTGDLGTDQGRIRPSRAAPAQGSWVMSLGSDVSPLVSLFRLDDPPLMWEQVIEKEDQDALTMRWHVIGPSRMPVVSVAGPFALSAGTTLVLTADDGSETVVWSDDDFVAIASATAEEVVAVLRRDLPDPWYAEATPWGAVRIEYLKTGRQTEVSLSGTSLPDIPFRRPVWKVFLQVESVRFYERWVRPGDDLVLSEAFAALEPVSISSEYRVGLALDVLDGVVGPVGLSDFIELELPVAYADDLIFGTVDKAPPFAACRAPEPGEERVRIDDAIRFDVVSTDSAVVAPLVDIYVTIGDGVETLVWSAGAAEPGWSGSTTTAISTNHQRYALLPDDPLPQLTEIRVRFGQPPSTTYGIWEFGTEDTTGPRIESVTTPTKRTIRVEFDEEVDDTAVEAGRYAVEPVDLPAVTPVVVSATRVSTHRIDLTPDRSLSPGRTYRLVVTDVDDAVGNGSGVLTAEFRAFVPTRAPLDRRFDLWELLPDWNRLDLDGAGDLYRFVGVIQEVVDVLLCEIDRFCDYIDPDLAPEQMLDLMLYDLGNPFGFPLDEELKRRLVQSLVSIYKTKGTAPGIEAAIMFFIGVEAQVVALNALGGWQLGVSELGVDTELGTGDVSLVYQFDVEVARALTSAELAIVLDIVRVMRPVNMRLRDVVEPPQSSDTDPNHLDLGLSELGVTWILH